MRLELEMRTQQKNVHCCLEHCSSASELRAVAWEYKDRVATTADLCMYYMAHLTASNKNKSTHQGLLAFCCPLNNRIVINHVTFQR